jgi:hypothetical protein
MTHTFRDRVLAVALERQAEVLATYQIDLLAELERQIRAVHHTMRHIEKLRAGKLRVGPELTNGQRIDTLASLAKEMIALDSQVATQHECCADMLTLIRKMQHHAVTFRHEAESGRITDPDSPGGTSSQSS